MQKDSVKLLKNGCAAVRNLFRRQQTQVFMKSKQGAHFKTCEKSLIRGLRTLIHRSGPHVLRLKILPGRSKGSTGSSSWRNRFLSRGRFSKRIRVMAGKTGRLF
jgi:hypothetical protein